MSSDLVNTGRQLMNLSLDIYNIKYVFWRKQKQFKSKNIDRKEDKETVYRQLYLNISLRLASLKTKFSF